MVYIELKEFERKEFIFDIINVCLYDQKGFDAIVEIVNESKKEKHANFQRINNAPCELDNKSTDVNAH